MLKIGITGGIGSGKTSACRVFETLGIPVYYADDRAKHLMNTDPGLKNLLQTFFGEDIYVNGMLDRRRLAGIIFQNKALLEKVNSWVHPAVARDFAEWCDRQTAPYVLEEAAVLFENGMVERFRKVILVTAPGHLRVKRVCGRDRVSPAAVHMRMENQWSDEQKIDLADYVIYNDESQLLIKQVLYIHQTLLSLANSSR